MGQKLSERVTVEILEMITLEKRFLPGDKLPNENDFCAELGVSRTTLRAAIQSLVNQKILEVQRGKGTFVSEKMGDVNSQFYEETTYHGMRLKDLYEVRLIFEPYSAYYSALRATEEELEKIQKYETILEEKLIAGEDCVEVNRMFHNAIAASTKNEFISHFVASVSSEIVKLFQKIGLKQEIHEHTISDHKMLMEYLKVKDPEGAKAAMKLHLLHSANDYLGE